MLLRFLVKFLLLTIILVAATILFAQWKLDKDIESFANSISSVAEFDYESAKISLTGEVRINSIQIYVESLKSTIEIGELRFFVGGLYELAFLESNIQKHLLPENGHLYLTDVLIPFSANMLKAVKDDSPPDSLDLINAAFCGENDRYGLQQLEASGYNYLSFSSKSFYLLDKYSGSVVLNGDAKLEEMLDLEYQVNISGVLAWMESLQERGVGQFQPAENKPELSLLELRLKDKGFNRKRAEYCAIQEGVTPEQYYTGHVAAVNDLFNSVELKMSDNMREAYSNVIRPETSLVGFVQPKASFEFDGINFYSQQEFLQMSGLRLSVNGTKVEQYFENWSMKAFKQIALNEIRRRVEETTPHNYQPVVVERTFQEVNPANAAEFETKTVRITRDDGRAFEGTLSRTSMKSLWLLQRSPVGDVTIPFERTRVVKLEVYQ